MESNENIIIPSLREITNITIPTLDNKLELWFSGEQYLYYNLMCTEKDKFIVRNIQDSGLLFKYATASELKCSSRPEIEKSQITKNSIKTVYSRYFKLFPDELSKLITLSDKDTSYSTLLNPTLEENLLSAEIVSDIIDGEKLFRKNHDKMIDRLKPWINKRINKFSRQICLFLKYLSLDRPEFFKINMTGVKESLEWKQCENKISKDEDPSVGCFDELEKYVFLILFYFIEDQCT